MKSVLFVCMGNICRSPLAEGILQDIAKKDDVYDDIYVDSAGTIENSVGNEPDERMKLVAGKHGIELFHKARLITPDDLKIFDYILVADKEVMEIVKQMAAEYGMKGKLHYIRDFDEDQSSREIPDPYTGSMFAFERCYELTERSVRGFYRELRK
ncbi:MAG: low molecular weight phosphotyrosine protein phosphatase [Bacteroidetes bacterium]|nr:low molecular weight phosphotyrosine protein phosphatase [Bacteroidota bacterium]